MSKNSAIGIMDEAYFVPKKDILSWISNALRLDIFAIEDLGTGAVYCQLLDYAFGQRVPMHKLNWKAKFEYEFIHNLKVFLQSMEKIGITKKIDIQKLSKGKYQDNLEIVQWLKRYIELNGMANEQYKAQERRNYALLYSITQAKKALTTSFKTNTSFMTNSGIFLNTSVCSTSNKKPNPITKGKISNKENVYNENSKGTNNKLTEQMNEIKKILLSSEQAQSKLSDIHQVVFSQQKQKIQGNLTEIQAQLVQSDDQVLVF